ncbi:MAG: radical SAM protein [Candidatus Phosphoribacter sp.]
MKVLLVNPPTLHRWRPVTDELARTQTSPYFTRLLRDDPSPASTASTLPGEHLGLQSLAASLRAAGHEAAIVDACGEFHGSLDETARRVGAFENVDLIGLTGPTDVIGEVRWLISHLRDTGFGGPIVLGNDHATLNAQLELSATPGLTYVLRGEAEHSLTVLVAALGGQCELTDVPGLSWRAQDRICHNPHAQGVLELDALSRPVRDRTAEVVANGMAASMFTKRGCPYSCAHCTTGLVGARQGPTTGTGWRTKSPAVAAAEFLELGDAFGLTHLTIVDDLFVAKAAASHAWAYEFSELLIDARNTVTFMVDCRVDSLDEKLARTLVQAGLRRVFIGAESGSTAALSMLNKRYRGVSPADQVMTLKGLGIDVILGFIMMSPGDTPASIGESVAFLELVQGRDFRLFSQRARIYPGSLLESRVRQTAMLTGDFPFYGFEYADRQMGLVAHVVREATRRVGDLVERHAPLELGVDLRLFSALAQGIRRLSERPPLGDAGEDDIEQLIDCLVADCRSVVDVTGQQ